MRKLFALALVATLVVAAPQAEAVGLVADGNWVVLNDVMATGDFFTGTGTGSVNLAGATSYDFVAAGVMTFDITDYWVMTDQFEIYDNDALIWTTPNVPDWSAYTADPYDPLYWTGDQDVAWTSMPYSKSRLFFGAGSHSLKIRDIHIPPNVNGEPFGDGTTAFRLTEGAVPEPGTLLLLGGGLAAAAIRRRMKK